ncbi:unnamed protein product [Closterium sp. NIES-54]
MTRAAHHAGHAEAWAHRAYSQALHSIAEMDKLWTFGVGMIVPSRSLIPCLAHSFPHRLPLFPSQGASKNLNLMEMDKLWTMGDGGASKNLNLMEMDKLWTINKKLIDPVCPRHTAILLAARVPLILTNGPEAPFVRVLPRHKKHPPAGMKATVFARRVWLEGADARVIKEGEEVTLMDWGNAIVQRNTMRSGGDGEGAGKEGGAKEGGGEGEGEVEAMEGVLHLEGSVKTTKLKLTWLADSDELVPLTLVELDYLITKKKLDEGDDFLAALNPRTWWEEAAVGDANMRNLQRGDIVQLERKGYYICDQPLVRPHKPIVLIAIPDGRQRPPPGGAAAK